MPHIDLQGREPGIIGLMQYRPDTAAPMLELAEVLLRAESTLTRGERELIAAYVSSRNNCTYCTTSHAQLAAKQLDGGQELVDAVCRDLGDGRVSAKMLALLKISGAVQRSGSSVSDSMVTIAREAGATDLEIHDAVLIAAAFSMYNRYVDGLATLTPEEGETYDQLTDMMVAQGYVALTPANGPERY